MELPTIAVREAHGEDQGDVQLEPGPLSGFRCLDDERPCQRECRFNLTADRIKAAARWTDGGAYGARSAKSLARIKGEMLPHGTCAMDLAAQGPLTLEQVGDQMGLTRERVRQIEEVALRKMMRAEYDETGEPETPLGGLAWRIGKGDR
jgi:hypothetical protein